MIRKSTLAALFTILPTLLAAQVKSVADQVPTNALISILQPPYVGLDRAVTVRSLVTDGDNVIRLRLSDNATQLPISTAQITTARDSLRLWLNKPNASLSITAGKTDLVAQAVNDTSSCAMPPKGSPVIRQDQGFSGPLSGRNIALWASHGRYYEASLDRWEWQRGRLNTTVEDLLTPSIAYPFLIPMLENAGAVVLSPRERDTTSVSTIIDDADPAPAFTSSLKPYSTTKGFARYETLRLKDNPFTFGKALIFKMSPSDSVVFTGKAPSTGLATLYIAYAQIPDAQAPALVTVRHATGEAHFSINQRMGGGMWLPLATLPFHEGSEFSVIIKGDGPVSVDAIRVGGGMGVVERNGATSGHPAWQEGARYYLQSDGFDYAKVLSLSEGRKDYTDDINCRGEWVNSLVADKHIPIDLSLALHTDAFVTRTDSVIGTLCLITTKKGDNKLPDGRNRLTSRQLAWLVMNSLKSDIHRSWDADWTLRGIADKGYSESRRPDVPALLLELLSHQNIADMSHALNPAFRRDAARAIYKGLLRYLAGPSAPVSPLPPSRVGLRFSASDSLSLHWGFTPDSLESSAIADSYEVYEGNRLIALTSDTSVFIHQPFDGKIRTYRVVAIGPGGRSMPSESVPACLWRNSRRALLVEGMDRLSAPAIIQTPQWSGVMMSQDPGAPWNADVFTTGEQYDFNPDNEWLDDDAPGCGASFANLEGVHMSSAATYSSSPSAIATSMRLEGFSFVGVTKSFFDADTTLADTTTYDFVRINLDRQRSTNYGDAGPRHQIYTLGFRNHTAAIVAQGIPTVISGCFIGSDVLDSDVLDWCVNTLGFKPRTAHASRTFSVTASPRWLRENCVTTRRPDVLFQQADAIEPAAEGARTLFRYSDSQMSAAVVFGNVVSVGL